VLLANKPEKQLIAKHSSLFELNCQGQRSKTS